MAEFEHFINLSREYVFILANLKDENSTSVGGEYVQGKLSLQSHSPGIILAVLGTILIMITIFIDQPIEKSDSAIYFGTQTGNRNIIDDLIERLSDSVGMINADSYIKPPFGL
jgi:hypothetical protein